MTRRYAEYAPLRRQHRLLSWRLRRGPFRTATLNVVGWSALLLACLVSAALGAGVVALAGGPAAWGMAAVLVPLLGVLVWDHRQWQRLSMGVGWGGGLEEVAAVAAEVDRRGGDVHVQTDHGWADGLPTVSLQLSGRDRRLVERVLLERGIPSPWRRRF